MAAFHGLDDDGSVLSIRVALRRGRMAEVWMVWKDKVRTTINIPRNKKQCLIRFSTSEGRRNLRPSSQSVRQRRRPFAGLVSGGRRHPDGAGTVSALAHLVQRHDEVTNTLSELLENLKHN